MIRYLSCVLVFLAACGYAGLDGDPIPSHDQPVMTQECENLLSAYEAPLVLRFLTAKPCKTEIWSPNVPWVVRRTNDCQDSSGVHTTYRTDSYFDTQVVVWYKNDHIMGYDSPSRPKCSSTYIDLVWKERGLYKSCTEKSVALCLY